jgi:hypothetical protein
VHVVVFYLACISLLSSELAFARQLNPCLGEWYLVQWRDCFVRRSSYIESIFMSIAERDSIMTRRAMLPSWAPLVARV